MIDRQKTANIFSLPVNRADEEQIDTLLQGGNIRVERIISHGHVSPPGFWYEQDEDEWIILLSGAATLAFDDGRPPQQLQHGDYQLIPAGLRHRVAWTDPQQDTIWLAIFTTDTVQQPE